MGVEEETVYVQVQKGFNLQVKSRRHPFPSAVQALGLRRVDPCMASCHGKIFLKKAQGLLTFVPY